MKKKTCRFIYKNYENIDDETKYIQIDINTLKGKKIYNSLLRGNEEINTVVKKETKSASK